MLSWMMSNWTPSIVPRDDDRNVYLVMDDLRDRHGRVWRDAYPETTGLETVITDLLKCQYNNPVRVVAFNTAECRAHDVSEDVARELRRRSDLELAELPECLQDFVTRFEAGDRKRPTLRLVS